MSMRVEELVGQRIREARERAGMTQPELGRWLAPLLGRELPRQAISLAEQGKRQFNASELVAFAYVVGCDVADLFVLPVEENHLRMPSGKDLSREDLRQAAAAGASDTKRLREALTNLVEAAEALQSNGFQAAQAARRLHDELEHVLVGAAEGGTS
jgi:transcriptional regulator with XRE-family HTH domain